MARRWRDNGLWLVTLGLFAVFFVGMALTGWRVNNSDLAAHGSATLGLVAYLTSGHFAEATFENWESEFLQMGMYVVLTAYLFTRGSSESKDPDAKAPQDEDPRSHANDAHVPGPVRRGGWRLRLYEHSLALFFLILFLGSVIGHAIGGAAEYSAEQVAHGEPPVTALEFMGTSQFWFESFQNWQSEFLAVLAIVVASIYLREKGSPESKPVHAAHRHTGD